MLIVHTWGKSTIKITFNFFVCFGKNISEGVDLQAIEWMVVGPLKDNPTWFWHHSFRSVENADRHREWAFRVFMSSSRILISSCVTGIVVAPISLEEGVRAFWSK